MRRLYYFLPIIAFGVLTYFLFGSLHAPPPDQLPSPLVGKPAPLTTARRMGHDPPHSAPRT